MPSFNVIIDLSHHNENVDLGSAQSNGTIGIIHKCSQGSGFTDPTFAATPQSRGCCRNLVGSVQLWNRRRSGGAGSLFSERRKSGAAGSIVLDFELNEAELSNTMSLDQARAFISTLQDAKGITPGLYGGALLEKQLGKSSDPILGTCWLRWGSTARRPLFRQIGPPGPFGNTQMVAMGVPHWGWMSSAHAIAISMAIRQLCFVKSGPTAV
jgi:lysozyme